jgi:hypothetical protein
LLHAFVRSVCKSKDLPPFPTAAPKRLDGQLGMSAVLHTRGQTLTRHVHLHCLVPGGALSEQGQWHPARSTYLFPVRALSRHVRGGFVNRLRRAVETSRLTRIKDVAQVDAMLNALMAIDVTVQLPLHRARVRVLRGIGVFLELQCALHALEKGVKRACSMAFM